MPALVKPSTPPPSCTVPLKVVLVFKAPAVSVAVPVLLVTVPAPASEPTLRLLPARFRVAPALTVVAELLPSAVAEPARSVPALTVVAPP